MPIYIKSAADIKKMRESGAITAGALNYVGSLIEPGITTGELDRAALSYIREKGATPTFLGYNGFPKNICVSVNNEVIHGIPGRRALKDGDIVSVDIGACREGFHGDAARTFACGKISDEAGRLIDVTKQSFFEGAKFAREGCHVSDISGAVQEYVEANGFSVVRDFVGHGVGKALHEPPEVPNFRGKRRGVTLRAGMTIAVEPMVNAGVYAVRVLGDEWTVVTADGSLSAHYENTILITAGEPEFLTLGLGETDG